MTASSTPPSGQDDTTSTFPLPADATAAGAARAHVRRLLDNWSLGSLVEPLTLVVSELAANAARYGRPPLLLLLRRLGSGVRVDVHDESREFRPRFPDPTTFSGNIESGTSPAAASNAATEGGRGLSLVQAVSSAAGIERIPDDGKRVWAVVEPEEPRPTSPHAEPSGPPNS